MLSPALSKYLSGIKRYLHKQGTGYRSSVPLKQSACQINITLFPRDDVKTEKSDLFFPSRPVSRWQAALTNPSSSVHDDREIMI